MDFKTNEYEIRTYLGLLFIGEYHHVSGEDDYWSTKTV